MAGSAHVPLRAAGPGAGAGRGDGVTATLAELVRCRPDRGLGGFAPGGRVTTHVAGRAASPFRGRGMEFDEARVYRPGDDVRAIDWRVTARTGTVHTKLFREERERPVLVLVDARASMRFGTRVRFKSVLAARVAATLSWVAIDGGDRLTGFTLGTDALRGLPSTRTRRGLLAWLHAVAEATRAPVAEASPEGPAPAEPSLARALARLRRVCRPGALVFAIGDFDDLDGGAEVELARLALRAHVTTVLVHDPLETALPTRGDLLVGDARVGTGGDARDVTALGRLRTAEREAHVSRLADRRARLDALARRRGTTSLAISTAEDPAELLRPSATGAGPLVRGTSSPRNARRVAA